MASNQTDSSWQNDDGDDSNAMTMTRSGEMIQQVETGPDKASSIPDESTADLAFHGRMMNSYSKSTYTHRISSERSSNLAHRAYLSKVLEPAV